MITNTFVDFEASRKLFVKRVVISGIFVLILLSLIMARYYDLQVTRHQDFVTQSDNNRVHVRPVSPTRGLIYDRNGKLLADNTPSPRPLAPLAPRPTPGTRRRQ